MLPLNHHAKLETKRGGQVIQLSFIGAKRRISVVCTTCLDNSTFRPTEKAAESNGVRWWTMALG